MMEVVEQGDEEEEGDSSGEEDEAEDIRQMVIQQNRKKKKSGGFQSMGELVSYSLISLDVIVGEVSVSGYMNESVAANCVPSHSL